MDNRGMPARVNSGLSEIRRYVAYHRIQDPSERWPFGRIYDYTNDEEAPEPWSGRINAETENVAIENNRETPIVISSESEDDSADDAAIANVGNIVNDSAINYVTEMANVSHCPNEGAQVEDRKGKRVASGSLISFTESESETDSEDDAAIEHHTQLNVAIQESFNPQNGEVPESSRRREAEDAVDENNRGAEIEYQRQMQVAMLESLNTQNVEAPESSRRREAENVVDENNLGAEYNRELEVAILESLNTQALQKGNIGNDSASNPVTELANVSHSPNEDSIDEGAQVEPLEADIGKLIDSGRTPRPLVSSRGRTLKPTVKQLELLNATGAPLPSKRKRKDGVSIDRQTKRKVVKPSPAVLRLNEGNITLNRRPRRFLRQQGVAGVSELSGSRLVVGQASPANGMAHQADVVNPNGPGSGVEVGVPEPSGSGSFVGQASLANGMAHQADVVNPNGSGAGVEVGVSEPCGSGSLRGQASEVNEVGRQTDMAAPILEPMVCVTNRNPMDLTVEQARTYMRSENRVTSTHKVKLFGTYIS